MKEMLEDMNAQPNSAEGFSAAVFYKTGQKYGLTCSEIMVNFLGKARALARGKYPATAPADPLETSRKPKAAVAPLKAAAKKVTKTKAEKPVKAEKKAKGKKETAADEAVVETPDDTPEDTPDENAVFTYIATPEEIADSYARPFALPE
jgi:hypothetical protein